MSVKAIWISFTVLVVGTVFIIWFLPGRGIRTYTVRTLQAMQNIYMDLDLLQENDASTLGESIKGETNTLELNRKIADFLKGSSDAYITNSERLVSSDGFFRDAWQRPLNFATTNSSSYARLNPQVVARKTSVFAVWSSGPNRTNELGFGDDLFLHR